MFDILQVTNPNVRWTEFICHWPLWAVYVAHFAMNWSNYIIMQWLPTYLARYLGANKESISLTAVPYIINSAVGIGTIISYNILFVFSLYITMLT